MLEVKRDILTLSNVLKGFSGGAVKAVTYHSHADIQYEYLPIPTIKQKVFTYQVGLRVWTAQISHHPHLERFHEGMVLMQDHTALKVYFQIAGESYGKSSL